MSDGSVIVLLVTVVYCCRVAVDEKIISNAAQSRGKSSIKLHNLFLINVGPVIIVAMKCRLIITHCECHSIDFGTVIILAYL